MSLDQEFAGLNEEAIVHRDDIGIVHSQRKPLAKSRSEKRPTINVQSVGNSLSQWPTRVTAGANLRK